jgi:predicted nucleic acid-binding protein
MTAAIFLEDKIDFYAPQFIFEEFDKYRDEILEKTKRSPDQLDRYLEFLKRKIIIIPKDYFVDFLAEARDISPDPDDEAYFALALNLGGGLWRNDKLLKEKQLAIRVFTTNDVVGMLFSDKT